MELTSGRRTADANSDEQNEYKRRRSYSIFELPSNFFDSCRFTDLLPTPELTNNLATTTGNTVEERDLAQENNASSSERWTCNTCKTSFESLHDQRIMPLQESGIENRRTSDILLCFSMHNVSLTTILSQIKLSIAGKDTVTEDDFDEWTSNSIVNDYDALSISGSENEENAEFGSLTRGLLESKKQKIFVRLSNGEMISFWKILLEHDLYGLIKDDNTPSVTIREVTERLLNVIHEPRNNTHFRVILLASGGHFSGCVFDGNSIVAHKTFHRYVIRAKSGKKQSSEDGSGKIANSAGASIRRHNELALKKDIQELLATWKPYFDSSSSIFIHTPSKNKKLLFNGENPLFNSQKNIIKHIPLTVKRPTFKEAQRLYKILTQISIETIPIIKKDSTFTLEKENPKNNSKHDNISENGFDKKVDYIFLPLHEAAKSGNVDKVMELLEEGLDPCVLDERGRAPYTVAVNKEVRNVFRRFMEMNFEKWDWEVAKVPSPLTKEMEESQKAKQAKKDAKRKARGKELKLLRKSREKKAQEDARNSDHGTRRISGRVAGVLVLVIGSLLVVAFGQMNRGRTSVSYVGDHCHVSRLPTSTSPLPHSYGIVVLMMMMKSVTLHTNLGDIKCEIACDEVPKASENFLALCASGYYDGTIFHRNIKGFMIQGGDPTGTGKGGTSIWGKKFNDEIRESLKHNARGMLSMANSGPNTNGSQFFITYAKQPHLNGLYTIFGKVIHGFEVLDLMEKTPIGAGDRPLAEIRINRITIHANPLAG
ncbi:hypothetical protein L2E82_45693 [Cichorium intybus]|uniref:Uncharacterized protein n=1 Tax=Cichorium intybus TaxID=13427 RepID=A0ACB8ZY31_CICIN|nr:hypothetical protein L2E82_45693 [Cichorium intybus]